MINALILFKNQEEEFCKNFLEEITSLFYKGGFNFSFIEILPSCDKSSFVKYYEDFLDRADNLIIINSSELEFDVKEVIAELSDSPLTENSNAVSFVKAVSKIEGKEYPESYYYIPSDATLIPNLTGAFQGFMLDNREFTTVVLPEEINAIKTMSEKYVLPYFEKKYGIKNRRLVLKYFGEKERLYSCLDKSKEFADNNYKYFVKEQNGDFTINLLFENESDKLSSSVIRYIISELKENVYAEFETSLSERVFDLLKLKNVKISVSESFTGGRVVSSIISNSGASKYVHEGIVSCSNESKAERLEVESDSIRREGAVSSIVAYQMALGLLKTGYCDLAVSTTGLAGPKTDESGKPVGLCYVGIGMQDGIHTYKLNLKGSREEITETAKNTALFLIIKKLKNIKE